MVVVMIVIVTMVMIVIMAMVVLVVRGLNEASCTGAGVDFFL